MVANTSTTQTGKGAIYVRICEPCTYVKEPDRFRKAPGAQDYDREMMIDQVGAGIAIAIPLKIQVPTNSNNIQVSVTTRCENCEVRPSDKLYVNF